MDFRTAEVATVLRRWLDRYSPPQAIQGKPQAMQDEVDALMRVLLRFLPREDYIPAVHQTLDRLAELMKTRAWPTVHEMGSAAKSVAKEGGARPSEGPADEYALAAARIRAGDAIGEDWFFGPKAKELVRRGLATELHLETYRSGLFFAMCDAYGDEAARRMIAKRRADHEAASFPTSEAELAAARAARGRQMPLVAE